MSQEPNTYSALGEVGAVSEKRSLWQRLILDLRKAPMTARFGMIVILGYIILAVFAPILSPYGEAEVFPEPYAAWSAEHVFGTDQIGRDIFSRMIYGARNTVGIAVATTLLLLLALAGFALLCSAPLALHRLVYTCMHCLCVYY